MKSECDAAITKMYVIVTEAAPFFVGTGQWIWTIKMLHLIAIFFMLKKYYTVATHTSNKKNFSYNITECNVR